jgi:hypothetical protein
MIFQQKPFIACGDCLLTLNLNCRLPYSVSKTCTIWTIVWIRCQPILFAFTLDELCILQRITCGSWGIHALTLSVIDNAFGLRLHIAKDRLLIFLCILWPTWYVEVTKILSAIDLYICKPRSCNRYIYQAWILLKPSIMHLTSTGPVQPHKQHLRSPFSTQPTGAVWLSIASA